MEYKIIEKITPGGSDRIFYRCLIKDKETCILVWDKDINTYLKLQRHLSERGIAVPEVIWADENSQLLLLEDLGDDSLFKLANKRRNRLPIYKASLTALVKLQIDGYNGAPIRARYDTEHMKWEQNYFKKNFLTQFCRLKRKQVRTINNDLEHLRKTLNKELEPWKNFLMHRDYQSQNIYIKRRKAKIIDFQSARIGPLMYDVAALLRDAYVKLKKQEEKQLLDHYLAQLKKRRIRIKKREFLRLYKLVALQRNMQALGAFANLYLNKDKEQFKQYIPRGLELLQTGLERTDYDALYTCVTSPEVCESVIYEA